MSQMFKAFSKYRDYYIIKSYTGVLKNVQKYVKGYANSERYQLEQFD